MIETKLKQTDNSTVFNGIKKTVEIVNKAIQEDGMFQTIIPFLSFMKSSKPTLLNRDILKPSFCIIVQGQKKIHIGKEIIQYGAGEYLISTIDIPTAGHIIGA